MAVYQLNDQPRADDGAALAHVAECIRTAARDNPDMPEFFRRLSDCGVSAVVRFGRNGRVRQFFYLHRGVEIAPSKLGGEFTWNALQKQLGVRFDRRVHQRALENGVAATADEPVAAIAPAASDAATNLAVDGAAMTDDTLVEKLSEKLNDLKELEARMCEIFERMREQQTRDARSDLDRMRAESVRGLADEFEKLRDDELAALSAAVAPLGESIDRLRADVQSVLDRVETERGALQKSVVDASQVSQELLSATQKMSEATASVIDDSSRSVKNVDRAVGRLRQESLWLALSAALISGLLAALFTGLWVARDVEEQVAQARTQIIEHLDKQAAEDPLRNYFNRLMEKLSR